MGSCERILKKFHLAAWHRLFVHTAEQKRLAILGGNAGTLEFYSYKFWRD